MISDKEIKEIAEKTLNFMCSLKFDELVSSTPDIFNEFKAQVIEELIRIAG